MSKIQFVFLSLFSLIPNFSLASSGLYVCETLDRNPAQSVVVSVANPTITFKQQFKGEDGQVKEKTEALITETTVSSYKVPRVNCEVKMNKSSVNASFTFDFSCNGLVGYLTFSADRGSGNYYEQLTGFKKKRRIAFVNCRVQEAGHQ